MSESTFVTAVTSSRRPARPFRRMVSIVPLFRSLWPDKTDAELAVRTGLSDRWCRKILAEKAKLSAEALAALLRTDSGLQVLEMLMGDARPKWWQGVKRQHRLASLREAIERQRLELERLEREAGT